MKVDVVLPLRRRRAAENRQFGVAHVDGCDGRPVRGGRPVALDDGLVRPGVQRLAGEFVPLLGLRRGGAGEEAGSDDRRACRLDAVASVEGHDPS